MTWLFPDDGLYHKLFRLETLPAQNQPTKVCRRFTAYCGLRVGDLGWYRSDLQPLSQPYCEECQSTE